MKVWGVSVSYFTGKLESYLRYKGIQYEREHPFADQKRIRRMVGAIQVPLIERDDGRWMTDSTPTILHLEQEHPKRPVLPEEPVVRFVAMLIEDYADEWLWRSAMHYRWSYEHDRELLSRILADEITPHLPLPRFVRRNLLKLRQRIGWVVNDGVNDDTRKHVELGYLNALRNMTTMLRDRPYLLGDTPSIADIGLMGPMLRHFGQDPTPAEIMRKEGPAVYEWLARVWNAGATAGEASFVNRVPDVARPMLEEIAQTHLVQLRENTLAHSRRESDFDMTVQGCRYRRIPVSRYRVYCLERLREHFAALDGPEQEEVEALLSYPECELLWQPGVPARSGYDVERQAPFNRGINVYDTDRAAGRFR